MSEPVLAMERRGRLIIAGSGMSAVEHLTPAARAWIRAASRVFYVVGDPVSERLIRTLNPNADDLSPLYDENLPRHQTYQMMVNVLVGSLHEHPVVCAVFYGHPGIFVNSGHDAVATARALGFQADLLPGISAEDCLFADLGVDPSSSGCQCYEATDFLTRRRVIDPNAGLVLWQVDGLGVLTAECMKEGFRPPHLEILAEVLAKSFGPAHPVTIYEAPIYPLCKPRIERIRIADLPAARVTGATTLYLPPKGPPPLDRNMVRRLGLSHLVKDSAVEKS
jgi:hypothetical protein